MDDLIRRQDAIDAIKEFQHGAAEWKGEQEERSDIWHRADSAIASAIEIKLRVKKIPSAQQWIPCSERLPDEYVSVLCYQPILYGSNIWIGHLNFDGNWVDSDGWEKLTNPVTAWMPLPKPYEEDANG